MAASTGRTAAHLAAALLVAAAARGVAASCGADPLQGFKYKLQYLAYSSEPHVPFYLNLRPPTAILGGLRGGLRHGAAVAASRRRGTQGAR